MIIIRKKLSLTEATRIGKSGSAQDVNYLMEILNNDAPIVICKLVDHAISLVKSEEGTIRLKYFLFNGTKIQRSYAALYFKRLEQYTILEQAVRQNRISREFAYCR